MATGIFYMARLLGRAAAYFVGGLLLKLYTHFDTIDLSTSVFAIFVRIYFYHSRSQGTIVFSSVRLCVCMSVWMSINTITSEPLEISSRNIQGIIV